MEQNSLVDKSKFIAPNGRLVTQSIFLEIGYNTDMAVYTLKRDDYEYKGVVYPSIRKRYMECSDPTEYEFANKHMLDWGHWLAVSNNTLIKPHVEEWREELEIKLRSEAIRKTMEIAKGGNYNAMRWLAQGEWKDKKTGRLSKSEKEAIVRKEMALGDVVNLDLERIRREG